MHLGAKNGVKKGFKLFPEYIYKYCALCLIFYHDGIFARKNLLVGKSLFNGTITTGKQYQAVASAIRLVDCDDPSLLTLITWMRYSGFNFVCNISLGKYNKIK